MAHGESVQREHGSQCRCATCRHARFKTGPPTNPRRLNYCGHFARGRLWKIVRVKRKLVSV